MKSKIARIELEKETKSEKTAKKHLRLINPKGGVGGGGVLLQFAAFLDKKPIFFLQLNRENRASGTNDITHDMRKREKESEEEKKAIWSLQLSLPKPRLRRGTNTDSAVRMDKPVCKIWTKKTTTKKLRESFLLHQT